MVGFFGSCNLSENKIEKIQFSGNAQGTYYAVTYYDSLGRNFQPQIDSLLNDFDQTASLWVDSSLLRKLNSNETVKLNSLIKDLFEKSFSVSETTSGYFDITVGKLVNAWGFGFLGNRTVDMLVIDSLKQYVGYDKIQIADSILVKENPNIEIDFNAIAQGYSVDMVVNYLLSQGVENLLVDIGGEVVARGAKPKGKMWVVGIEKPAESKYSTQKIEIKISLNDMAIVTSGSYRKYYESNGIKYSHNIDPFTGKPVEHSLLSVSVLAPNAWEADAMATAFMVMGLDKALEFLEKNDAYDAYFIFDENGEYKTYSTDGFEKIIIK